MKNFMKNGGLIVAGSIAGLSAAQAAVPADVSTALGDLKADVTTVAGLAFAAFLVVILFAYMRKAAH